MKSYEHRQASAAPILFVVGTAAVVLVVSLVGDTRSIGFLIGATLLATAVALAFSEIRSTVDADGVDVEFRFGRPARHIPIGSLIEHQVIRSAWWWGWGWRLVPGGTMFSVWGRSAVKVIYNDPTKGRKTFVIGTDDAEGLSAAITAAESPTR